MRSFDGFPHSEWNCCRNEQTDADRGMAGIGLCVLHSCTIGTYIYHKLYGQYGRSPRTLFAGAKIDIWQNFLCTFTRLMLYFSVSSSKQALTQTPSLAAILGWSHTDARALRTRTHQHQFT